MAKSSRATVLRGVLTVGAVFFALLCVGNVEAKLDDENLATPVPEESGRWTCVSCAMIVALVSQFAEVNKVTAKKGLQALCRLLPWKGALVCKLAGKRLCPKAFSLIDKGKTPDEVCRACEYCDDPTCHLFPLPKDAGDNLPPQYLEKDGSSLKKRALCRTLPALCKDGKSAIPSYDRDKDLFSTVSGLRGTDWRGRDCNDQNNSAFPGRDTLDAKVDENCNGIHGVDKNTGKTYEELWCRQSGAVGVIAVGDSATAQFGIPGGLLNVSQLSKELVASMIPLSGNNFDWPMLSYATGFANPDSYAPARSGPMTSIYSELLKLNRCNHRDFQNIGINGAETNDLPSMMDFVARNRTKHVKPAVMIFSFVGNDVCGLSPTTPEQYHNNIVTALGKADDRLPPGSHVIIAPVADGRILFETMHKRIYPIGSLHNDVTYSDFYDFLNCLGSSPCPGWLNTNASVRELTFQTVQQLNAEIPKIVNEAKSKYKNIKVHYFGDAAGEVLKTYKGPLWELIEPFDGFHPSQLAHSLMGKFFAEKIIEAGILGDANQFNDAIIKQFGDQGGH